MAVVRLHRLWFGVFFYVMFINVQQTFTVVSPADVELATDVCCSVCVGVPPIMAHDLSQWRFQGGAVVKADSLFPASASVAQLGWCCYFHDCKSLRERWSRMPQCFNRCKVAVSMKKDADAQIPSYPNLQSKLFCILHKITLHSLVIYMCAGTIQQPGSGDGDDWCPAGRKLKTWRSCCCCCQLLTCRRLMIAGNGSTLLMVAWIQANLEGSSTESKIKFRFIIFRGTIGSLLGSTSSRGDWKWESFMQGMWL